MYSLVHEVRKLATNHIAEFGNLECISGDPSQETLGLGDTRVEIWFIQVTRNDFRLSNREALPRHIGKPRRLNECQREVGSGMRWQIYKAILKGMKGLFKVWQKRVDVGDPVPVLKLKEGSHAEPHLRSLYKLPRDGSVSDHQGLEFPKSEAFLR